MKTISAAKARIMSRVTMGGRVSGRLFNEEDFTIYTVDNFFRGGIGVPR